MLPFFDRASPPSCNRNVTQDTTGDSEKQYLPDNAADRRFFSFEVCGMVGVGGGRGESIT